MSVSEAGQTRALPRDSIYREEYTLHRKLLRKVSAYFHGDDKGNAIQDRLEREIRETLAELNAFKGRVHS